PVTKRFTDRSTQKVFMFSFFCDQCGIEWRSTPKAYDPGGLRLPTDLRIYRMLWNEQYKEAYEQANLEAIYLFCLCQECGRRVCIDCFRSYEAEASDVCKDCLAKKMEGNQDACGKKKG
ncbi:MAG: hypothetical protein FWF86_03190, partial [Clostridia bacterium]|nr:hypothetical protein [Clostridia bacterium]